MINQDINEDIITLFDEFTQFIFDNFAALVIVFLLILIGLIVLIRFIYNRRSESRRHQLGKWRSLKAKHEKLTNRLRLKVYPFGRNDFEVKGDLYVIDSRIHEKEYTVKEIVDKSIAKIDEEIQQIKNQKESHKKKYPSYKEADLERYDRLVADLESNKQKLEVIDKEEAPKDQKKLIIKNKTETYVALDARQNKLVGIRYTDLKPTQTILSQTGFLELSRIDPRRSNWVFYISIAILMGLQFILWWAIFAEVEPTFLFEPNMWGWYATLGVTFGFTIYIVHVLMGFYAIVYAKQVTNEDVRLRTSQDESFTINIEIFWVKTYFYPGINVEEVLDINADILAKQINQDNRKLISELSTENATLRGDLEFAQAMLNKKSEIIDTMEERLLIERALGYYEGRQDNTATPMLEQEHRIGLGVDWTIILSRSIPFVFGLIALIIMAYAVKFIADSVHLTEIQMTLLLIVGGLLIGGFVLIALRSVFESTRRSPVG